MPTINTTKALFPIPKAFFLENRFWKDYWINIWSLQIDFWNMQMPHYMTGPVSQYVALNVDWKCMPSKKFQILFSLFPWGKHIGQEKGIKQEVVRISVLNTSSSCCMSLALFCYQYPIVCRFLLSMNWPSVNWVEILIIKQEEDPK